MNSCIMGDDNLMEMEYVNCCLCEEDDTKIVFKEGSLKIVQCNKCGLS